VNYDNSLVVTITVTTHGHHLAVTIYLHVAPSTDRHSSPRLCYAMYLASELSNENLKIYAQHLLWAVFAAPVA